MTRSLGFETDQKIKSAEHFLYSLFLGSGALILISAELEGNYFLFLGDNLIVLFCFDKPGR